MIGNQKQEPLRGKIFNEQELFQLGKELAKTQRAKVDPQQPSKILPEFKKNFDLLKELHQSLVRVSNGDRSFSPAAEWLVDNFYIIHEHLKDCQANLPQKGYPQLPKLKPGEKQGYPRVYQIVEEFLIHTDARFDLDQFHQFIKGYQSQNGLTTKELWILPMMLRLALIENLKRLEIRVLKVEKQQRKADLWADRFLKEKDLPNKKQGSTFQELTSSFPEPSPAFALQLLERLYNQGRNIVPLLKWLKRDLNRRGLTLESAISKERHRQAADQISVTNTIDSMRQILTLEWKKIVEKLSHLEKILKQDPGGYYSQMDFKTRNQYRNLIQKLSSKTRFGEREIAQKLVKLASQNQKQRKRHLGFYLIGEGEQEFKQKINYQPGFKERLQNWVFSNPAPVYFTSVGGLTALFLGLILNLGNSLGAGWKILLTMGVAGLIPCSELAVNAVHFLVSTQVSPKPIPKLQFKEKIPSQYSTIVVIPAFLRSKEEISELVQSLEVHYLANRVSNLHFALLLDFKDASQKRLPSDQKLLKIAQNKIRDLNSKYPAQFFLLTRKRKWNPKEELWMGWERKRGKLREFNRFLLGRDQTSFSVFGGNKEVFSKIKYVITLDQDTKLPKDQARKLVGAMAHPLNQPQLNSQKDRVVKGYGALQPKLGISLKEARKSLLAEIFSGPKGLDPYTGLVSDLYQDLFSEGRYMGKGIYEVQTFETVLGNKFPENLFLSHDHVEGFLARTGFVSDIELFEDFPSNYRSFCIRKNRWERGDFQVINWLTNHIQNKKGERIENPLPAIGRWVLFNNLRRHLTPVMNFLFINLGWFLFPRSPLIWTLLILLEMSFFVLANLTFSAIKQPSFPDFRKGWKGWVKKISSSINWIKKLSVSFKRILLGLIFQAHQAVLMLQGMSQALIRKFITGKKLLQWTTAFSAERFSTNSLLGMIWFMKKGVLLGIIALGAALIQDLGMVVKGICLGWVLSPMIAWWISRPRIRKIQFKKKTELNLRRLARKNWRYFEDFVGADTHFLPPDTFQDTPQKRMAWKTSPTNIGFLLLSTISAHDLGYISSLDLLNRLEQILSTLKRLKKYRGHLFNWYNIKTLEPLSPAYVSSVDSGNLAASIMIVQQSLQELEKSPFLSHKITQGLKDSFKLLQEKGSELKQEKFNQDLKKLKRAISKKPDSSWRKYLRQVKRRIYPLRTYVREKMKQPKTPQSRPITEVWYWLEKISSQVDDFYYERSGLSANPQKSRENLKKHSQDLSQEYNRLLNKMDFEFLYDPQQKLLSLGFRVDKKELDQIYYNFLSSEARLASLVAIAKGDLPAEHWFNLGRSLTKFDGQKAAISWGGSLYEYLMPELMLKSYPNTLLGETARVAIRKHIQYGKNEKVPWGISESTYNVQNQEGFYRYQAFGIPSLGVKPSLGKELVVSPYSTMLALSLFPRKAVKNLNRLKQQGLEGKYGFYDAIDYTPQRIPAGSQGETIPTYLALHQSLSLIALNNSLHSDLISKRLYSDSRIKSIEHFLEEKMPHRAPVFELYKLQKPKAPKVPKPEYGFSIQPIKDFYKKVPVSYILSNGKYQVMMDEGGAGFSKFQNFYLTRFRSDPTQRNSGTFFYIKDQNRGKWWSSTFQPTLKEPEKYQMLQHENKIEFTRTDHGIETQTEVVVPPREQAEIRRITLANRSSQARELEITSYGEVTLNYQDQDLTHPPFSKMFVDSEFLDSKQALIFHRKPKTKTETPLWATHLVSGKKQGSVQYTTDRKEFIGRGQSKKEPQALEQELSGYTGHALDPIMSLRVKIKLAPGEKREIGFVSAISFNKEEILALADKYSEMSAVNRAIRLGESYGQLEMRQFAFSPQENLIFQKLASRIIWPKGKLRSKEGIKKNRKKVRDLWGYSISGDYPIVLVQVSNLKHLPLIRQVLRAQRFWRRKGLIFDLLILNKGGGGYKRELKERIQALSKVEVSEIWGEERGGVFVLRDDLVPKPDQNLIKALSKVMLKGEQGSLREQLESKKEQKTPPPFTPSREQQPEPKSIKVEDSVDLDQLLFYNRRGGFDPERKEYLITLESDQQTPSPWTNVISNPEFGFVVSESGSQFTFKDNSRDNRLTPWFGDSVSNPSGETFFLRDQETGEIFSPTLWPKTDQNPYLIRQGLGYVKFEHSTQKIDSNLTLFVPLEDPVKIAKLKLKNLGSEPRKLSVWYFVEWVLGELRSNCWDQIITEIDPETGAITARNPFNKKFSDQTALVWTQDPDSVSGDREEILGPGGDRAQPAALDRKKLSGNLGPGMDPGAGLQKIVELNPDQQKEIIFLLGEVDKKEQIEELVQKYKSPSKVKNALEKVRNFWEQTLAPVQIHTPDQGFDLLMNQWLLYQVLSCRVWAKSSFYQAGGAFGFRDQLQDAGALGLSRPQILKNQILKAAKRQFPNGAVQHWWKPNTGLGLQSNYSDDPLWLAYLTAYYVNLTSDFEILSEKIPFLESSELAYPEMEVMETPKTSDQKATLFEHCLRAIRKTLDLGAHGLPKIGRGDWNDAMNKIGLGGQGESVWLGWFQVVVLEEFAELAKIFGEKKTAQRLKSQVEKIKQGLERTGWDGKWYKRAYFDDGTPLGSEQNSECKITLLPQAWALISSQADKKRLEKAQAACEKYLIDDQQKLIKLLAPAFENPKQDPGYIKNYPQGVRENGACYVHGAMFYIMGLLLSGQGDRAWDLFSYLNPIKRSSTLKQVRNYQTEPYAVASDIYSGSRSGTGGWTWYTGSAALMYRIGLEYILGLKVKGQEFTVDPCIPRSWEEYRIDFKQNSTLYQITVHNPNQVQKGVQKIKVDGKIREDKKIPIYKDRETHQVEVFLGD